MVVISVPDATCQGDAGGGGYTTVQYSRGTGRGANTTTVVVQAGSAQLSVSASSLKTLLLYGSTTVARHTDIPTEAWVHYGDSNFFSSFYAWLVLSFSIGHIIELVHSRTYPGYHDTTTIECDIVTWH